MPGYIKKGGIWNLIKQPGVKKNGIWNNAKTGYVKRGGIWDIWFTAGGESGPPAVKNFRLIETTNLTTTWGDRKFSWEPVQGATYYEIIVMAQRNNSLSYASTDMCLGRDPDGWFENTPAGSFEPALPVYWNFFRVDGGATSEATIPNQWWADFWTNGGSGGFGNQGYVSIRMRACTDTKKGVLGSNWMCIRLQNAVSKYTMRASPRLRACVVTSPSATVGFTPTVEIDWDDPGFSISSCSILAPSGAMVAARQTSFRALPKNTPTELANVSETWGQAIACGIAIVNSRESFSYAYFLWIHDDDLTVNPLLIGDDGRGFNMLTPQEAFDNGGPATWLNYKEEIFTLTVGENIYDAGSFKDRGWVKAGTSLNPVEIGGLEPKILRGAQPLPSGSFNLYQMARSGLFSCNVIVDEGWAGARGNFFWIGYGSGKNEYSRHLLWNNSTLDFLGDGTVRNNWIGTGSAVGSRWQFLLNEQPLTYTMYSWTVL